jgi:hypothetical protein
MLVNCPECSSPVFVRSAAIEKRKPQRCYSCKAQLLVGEDGSVDVAVGGDEEALEAKAGKGLTQASPDGPPPKSFAAQATAVVSPNIPAAATAPASDDADATAIVDLSDEAMPLDDEDEEVEESPTKVNAVFGGAITSGEADSPAGGAAAPAPIFLGELDVDAPTSAPNQAWPGTTEAPATPTTQAEPATPSAPATDEAEPEPDWPTMISKTPYAGASGANVPSPTPEERSEPLAPQPTLSSLQSPITPAVQQPLDDPLLAQPTMVSNASTNLAATAMGAETQEPSLPSTLGDPIEDADEPTRVDDTGAAAMPRPADNRFTITGEDSGGEPAAPAEPEQPGNLFESWDQKGTVVGDVPPELLNQARAEPPEDNPALTAATFGLEDSFDSMFGAPGQMLSAEAEEATQLEEAQILEAEEVVDSGPALVTGALLDDEPVVGDLAPMDTAVDAPVPQPPVIQPPGPPPMTDPHAPSLIMLQEQVDEQPPPQQAPVPQDPDDDMPATKVEIPSGEGAPASDEDMLATRVDAPSPSDEAHASDDLPPMLSPDDQALPVLTLDAADEIPPEPASDLEPIREPEISSPYVHTTPKKGGGVVALAAAVILGGALGAGAAFLLRPVDKPTPTARVLLEAGDHLQNERPDDAILILEPLVKEEPDNALALRRLAVAYAAAGRSDDAERTLLRYIAVAPAEDAAEARAALGLE